MTQHARTVAGFPYDPGTGLSGESAVREEEAGFEDCRPRCRLYAGRLRRLAPVCAKGVISIRDREGNSTY